MMVDPKVLDITNKVIDKMPTENKQLGIIQMIQIALALLYIFRQCKHLLDNPSRGVEIAKHPGLYQEWRVYRTARRFFPDLNSKDRQLIVNAILKAGKEATEDDIKVLVSQSNRSSWH